MLGYNTFDVQAMKAKFNRSKAFLDVINGSKKSNVKPQQITGRSHLSHTSVKPDS